MRFFGLFKKKQPMSSTTDRVEARFQVIVDLIRDLDCKEFNRLKEGIDLAWQAYQKVSLAQTTTEKELDLVDGLERTVEEITNA